MRTVVVSNIVSLDGFYAAADGNPLVLNMDEAFDEYNRERIEAADIVLLGRNSFEGFSAYWPSVANAPADPGNRALSEDNRRISRAYNSVSKVVVSDNLKISPDNPWHKTPLSSLELLLLNGSMQPGAKATETSSFLQAGSSGTACSPGD